MQASLTRGLGHFIAFALYAVLPFFYMSPIERVFSTHLAPDLGDPLYYLYVLEWDKRQIELALPSLWDANFFFPTKGTLAFSDHLIGPATQLYLLRRLLPTPVAGYNTLLLSSFVLSGFAAYWVMRKAGLGWASACLGGLFYGFSPFRWGQTSHFAILLGQWVPLVLWYWDQWLEKDRVADLLLFLIYYLLNITGGCYLAYMIHIPMLLLLLNRWRDILSTRSISHRVYSSAAVAFVSLASFSWLYLPYLRVAGELGLKRHESEVRDFGATLASYITPSLNSSYPQGWIELLYRQENVLFAGFVPTALLMMAAARWWRRGLGLRQLKMIRSIILLALVSVAILALVLADTYTIEGSSWVPLGALPVALRGYGLPLVLWIVAAVTIFYLVRRWRGRLALLSGQLTGWDWGIWLSGWVCAALTFPMFYLPAQRLLPGLSSMRVSARFYVLVSFSLAFFAARALNEMTRSLRAPLQSLLCGVLLLLFIVEARPQLKWHRLPKRSEFPKIYEWISHEDSVKAILELPFRRLNQNILYMYYSTSHWKPIANGYSGYVTPQYMTLLEHCRPFPDHAALQLLRDMGVTHLVIHGDELREKWFLKSLPAWRKEYVRGAVLEVRLVHTAGPVWAYEIVPASSVKD